MEQYLECAAICSTHGVKGAVRLECRCNTTADLAALRRMYMKKNGEIKELHAKSSFVQKYMVVVTFEEITSVEAAQALKGTVLYADRSDFKLPKGEFFIADMIGLPVVDCESGDTVGKLKDVIKPGAQQIYVVERGEGTFMIPAVPEFIKEISLEEGIKVKLIEGLVD